MKQEVAKLFVQKADESLVKAKHAEPFFAGNHDGRVMLSYGPFFKMAQQQSQMPPMVGFEFMEKMILVGTSDFEKGEIVNKFEMLFTDAEGEKQAEEFYGAFTSPIQGDILGMIPNRNIAIMAANLKGEGLYSVLEKNPMLAMGLGALPEVRQIMGAIDGDMAIAFHGMKEDASAPLMTFAAQVKDVSVLETITGLLPVKSVEQQPGHHYLNIPFDIWFGVHGNHLYVTTSETALPYLRGVQSPGEEGASRYESQQIFTLEQGAQALGAAFPTAGLTPEELPAQLEVLRRFPSGRVDAIRVGTTTVTGRQFRGALGLFSANFALDFTTDEVIVDQRGYGHGVGMSQAGADAMARAGSDYETILKHYYTGVELREM